LAISFKCIASEASEPRAAAGDQYKAMITGAPADTHLSNLSPTNQIYDHQSELTLRPKIHSLSSALHGFVQQVHQNLIERLQQSHNKMYNIWTCKNLLSNNSTTLNQSTSIMDFGPQFASWPYKPFLINSLIHFFLVVNLGLNCKPVRQPLNHLKSCQYDGFGR